MAAGKAELKLLGFWPSPFVGRVIIALHLKGLQYEFIEEKILSGKSDLLLKSNPVYAKIPVLIHGGKPVCESMLIVQYIDETFQTSPILPEDAHDRAVARFWVSYIDDKILSTGIAMMAAKDDAARLSEVEKLVGYMEQLEEAFVACSKGKRLFFGGDTIGYVDIALGCFLAWFDAWEKIFSHKFLDEAKTPQLFKWAERFRAADAAKGALQETDKLVDFIKTAFLNNVMP